MGGAGPGGSRHGRSLMFAWQEEEGWWSRWMTRAGGLASPHTTGTKKIKLQKLIMKILLQECLLELILVIASRRVLIVVVLVMPLYFIINKNLFSDKRDLECFNEINQIKN